jgi:hypothetical protein
MGSATHKLYMIMLIICNRHWYSKGKEKKLAVALLREPYGEIADRTGVSLAIAARIIIEVKVANKGLLIPEEAFPDPTEFFNKLTHHKQVPYYSTL